MVVLNMNIIDWLSSHKKVHNKIIRRIQHENLTYLSKKKLKSIVNVCNSLVDKKVQGAFLEAGCALGGSSILISSLKPTSTPLYLFDVFSTIPAPTDSDPKEIHDRYEIIKSGEAKGIGSDIYYGYIDNLEDLVRDNLDRFGFNCNHNNISLIKGLLQETLHIDQPIAFAHIDVDWYDPVKICLERIFPRLTVGGSMIIDDYFDWESCKKAVDEYLYTIKGNFSKNTSYGNMIITKTET